MSFTLSVSEVEASSPLCPLLVYTLGALDGAGLPELIWELTAILDLTGLRTGVPHRIRLRTNLEVYWDSHYRAYSVIHDANDSSPELIESALRLPRQCPTLRSTEVSAIRFRTQCSNNPMQS